MTIWEEGTHYIITYQSRYLSQHTVSRAVSHPEHFKQYTYVSRTGNLAQAAAFRTRDDALRAIDAVRSAANKPPKLGIQKVIVSVVK